MSESVSGRSHEHQIMHEQWIRSVSDVAAPLLAGFSFAAVIAVSGDTGHRRWPGLTILALTIATVNLIAAVQMSKYARDTNQPTAERWLRRTRNFYHLGMVTLLLGLGFALAPQHVAGLQDVLRWIASGVAFATCAWTIAMSWTRMRAAILSPSSIGLHEYRHQPWREHSESGG